MCNLYNRIDELCNINNTNITAMCRELKISRSSLSELKSGRAKSLSADKIAKIATFFKVSVNYLLTGNNDPESTSEINSNDNLKFALFGTAEVDDEIYEQVKAFAKFALNSKKENKDK